MVRGGLLVTQDESRAVHQGDLFIEGHEISQVGRVSASADLEMDAEGCLVLPGLINCFTRAAHTLLGPPRNESPEALRERMTSLAGQATKRDVELGAALAAAEMVLRGTTAFLDLSPWGEEVARAATEVGCRGYLAQEVDSSDDIRACERFLRRVSGWERMVAMVGVTGIGRTDLLKSCHDLALQARTRWCLPLAETRGEVYAFQKALGKRPVEWLEESGLLSPSLVPIHAVWITLNEVRALARTKTGVVHCPLSNQMTGGGGVTPLPELLGEGVPVGLGTDSPFIVGSLDLFSHLRSCVALHRGQRWDPRLLSAQQLLDLCTTSAAETLGLAGGCLQPGRVADVVILDPGGGLPVNPDPGEVLSYLVHVASGMQVRDVIVDGRLVVQGGCLQTVDLKELREGVASLRGELFHEAPGHR